MDQIYWAQLILLLIIGAELLHTIYRTVQHRSEKALKKHVASGKTAFVVLKCPNRECERMEWWNYNTYQEEKEKVCEGCGERLMTGFEENNHLFRKTEYFWRG